MKLIRPLIFAALAATAFGAQAAKLPQSAELQYSGSYGIPATMTFTRSGNNYKIVSNIKVPMYSIRFESGGTIKGNTLVPSYYRDVRGGKTYAEAKLSGGRITYGKAGEEKTESISGTTQDLFTLAWQLAVNDGKLPAGLQITNGKKLYKVNGLARNGSASYSIAGGTTTINKYRLQRGDSTVNYAFAPALSNVPTQISYTDDGKTYDLQLKSIKINGKEVKP